MLAADPTPRPLADPARQQNRSRARTLRTLIATRGGATLEHGSGRALDDGVAVCADPGLAWRFPFAAWEDRRVTAWLDAQHARLTAGDVHIGGWLERGTGDVWLELVWVLPHRLEPAALAIGRMHDQRAVYDLRRRRLLPLDADERQAVG